jgi:hypothetical protein
MAGCVANLKEPSYLLHIVNITLPVLVGEKFFFKYDLNLDKCISHD